MRVLIVGSGFIGRAVGRAVAGAGDEPFLASRHSAGPDRTAKWTRLDATVRSSCVRVLDALSPDAVVLVHGPSDVTWCEVNPGAAMRDHEAAASNLAALATGAKLLLISTDNVFDGTAEINDELVPPRPANAYGRAKLRAERVVAERAHEATILRVSLVYGWEPAGAAKWLNFFAACAHRLRSGMPVEAPADLWTTPVFVDDVAILVNALIRDTPGRLLHLGGPDRVSRSEWAAMIAAEVGADPGLVVPVPRSRGRYSCRPQNSCLASVYLKRLAATRDIRVRGLREMTRVLVTDGFPAP